MTKYAFALLASVALTAPAQAQNLLTNGSFESGFAGWTLGGTSGDGFPPVVIPYNSSAGYPGGAFGEPIPNDDAVGNPGFDPVGDKAVYFVADLARPQTLSQMVNIVAGTSYTFGFDVYLPANGAANGNDATLSATVGGFTFASFSASASPVQDWVHFSSAGVATGTGLVDFIFTYNSFGVPAKDFVIDRVYFATTASVPEPATWAMMLMGFGIIGFAMRRRQNVRVSFV
jgi:PEP-CTERM motif